MTNTKLKPDWAGEDLLSKIVNLLITNKFIYPLMKNQARQVIIKTAEKNGISWRKSAQSLDNDHVKQIFTEIINQNIVYPAYYQVPFHAYDQGNLCWKAAFEATPATQAMALRVWKNEPLTWEVAQSRLRQSFLEILGKYTPKHIENVLDIGCSVGISTLALHRYLSQQNHNINTIGLDLSPYMLAVAKYQDTEGEIKQWVHGLAEKTNFPDNYFDVITLQFVVHELPHLPTQEIFKEVLRILKPGGCFAIVDNNPKSPVIQNLPPVLFTLMKSTEPWSDEYYTFDIESNLKEIGFNYQITVPSDPRHRTIIALKHE